MDRTITREIVGCETCKCSGVTRREELVDYHRRDYETITEICKKCGGAGRLVETTETVRISVLMTETGTEERAVFSKKSLSLLVSTTATFYAEKLS